MTINFNSFLECLEKNPKTTIAAAAIGTTGYFAIKGLAEYMTDSAKERRKLKGLVKLEEEKRKTYKSNREEDAKLHRTNAEVDAQMKESVSKNSVKPCDDEVAKDAPRFESDFASFQDSLNRDSKEMEWLVGNLIEVGGRSIIFGPAGVGKSLLSLQLAIAIAGGTEYGVLPKGEENNHDGQQVILFDFEMSDAEQRKRTQGVKIPSSLYRVTNGINNLDDLFGLVEEKSYGSKVTVIIDNIRKLEQQMSNAGNVCDYYNKLEETQDRMAERGITVTFITITHTDKNWEKSKPTEMRNIAGGADLSRFCTSSYALVPARDKSIMLKAVKQRNSAKTDDVYVLRFSENPNLHLEFDRKCNEESALPDKPTKKPQADDITSASPNLPKKAPNQKLGAEEDLLLLEWQSQGKKPKEMVELLHERGIKVTDKAIRNHLNRLKNSAG